jgi:hypothetical protein
MIAMEERHKTVQCLMALFCSVLEMLTLKHYALKMHLRASKRVPESTPRGFQAWYILFLVQFA